MTDCRAGHSDSDAEMAVDILNFVLERNSEFGSPEVLAGICQRGIRGHKPCLDKTNLPT